MRTKILCFLLASSLVALAAWLVHVPNPTQADEIPEKYRETVRKGLEFLAKNQFADGHWEGDGGQHPVAMTGLAGLAMLMEMESPNGQPRNRVRKYAVNIRMAVDWLMSKSQPGRDGLIFSGHASETARYMQGHGLATLFLAGAYEDEMEGMHRKKLKDVLIRAVKYIVKAQSSQGGWYHTSKAEGHDFSAILPTVIQMQALQAAENIGPPVPDEISVAGQEYLRMTMKEYEGGTKPEQKRGRPADKAATLACLLTTNSRIKMAESRGDFLQMQKWIKHCHTEIRVSQPSQVAYDELGHYYYAQALFRQNGRLDGSNWSEFRKTTFDYLQSSQHKDGSWPAGDGLGVGPVYSTALWSTVLQLDNRTHPLMRHEEIIK